MCSHSLWLHSVQGLGPRMRDEPMKIPHSQLQNVEAGPGGFARRKIRLQGGQALPPSQFAHSKCLKHETPQTNKRSASPAPQTSFPYWTGAGRLLARAEGGFCLLRAEACGAGLWPPRIPAAAPQQTPSRALSSANWSCEFEQKGNCVS